MSGSSRVQRRRLGDILADEGLVPRESIEEALRIQAATGETLGAILLDMGCIAGPDIARTMCHHFQLPFISLRHYDVDTRLLELFEPEFLHQHKLMPFDSIGTMVLCAVSEIPAEKVLADIPRLTRRKVAFFVAELEEISKLLQTHRPLPENSQLLKRRQHIQLKAPQPAAPPPAESQKFFSEQNSQQLLDALDSTWDSIFEAVEDGSDDSTGADASEDSAS